MSRIHRRGTLVENPSPSHQPSFSQIFTEQSKSSFSSKIAFQSDIWKQQLKMGCWLDWHDNPTHGREATKGDDSSLFPYADPLPTTKPPYAQHIANCNSTKSSHTRDLPTARNFVPLNVMFFSLQDWTTSKYKMSPFLHTVLWDRVIRG